ncbi:MAG: zf-HC2 domain-containing protein [Clostridiales bacterium]|jgi:predicted anti-sigma-YlaC factor YlaD|nr:zf-HC2 domain-containing protein [Clostridiales bacterium]
MNNSSCSIIQDLLPLYEDKVLSPKTAEVVKHHLEKCSECREYRTHIHHVVRAMQNQNARNNYRYSEVVRKIRRSFLIELAVGAAVFSFACAALIKLASRE